MRIVRCIAPATGRFADGSVDEDDVEKMKCELGAMDGDESDGFRLRCQWQQSNGED